MRIYFTGVIIILKDDFETNSILTDCAAVMIYDKFRSAVHNSWPECSIGWLSSSESCCCDVSAPSSILATSLGVPDKSALSSVLLES